jgi:4-aminobutyrate aminotransferase/(S)-3-amino-2-methylpropionate transaminase
MTSKVKPYKFKFGPFAPEIYHMPNANCYRCPFGKTYPSCQTACADHLEDFFIEHVAAEQVAALIVEPIQGEGGFITPPQEYFAKLQAICRKHGIVLVIDEIQSGMGRTGKLYAIEHWGIEPDMILTAKSLGGGLPLSAVTGRAELMDAPHAGGLGGTFSGNPIACAAALAVLEVLVEDGLVARAEALGVKARARLDAMQARFELIGDVRGKGPMLAIELVRDRQLKTPAADETKELVKLCFERGLMVLSCGQYGNVIRTLMPLVITDQELDRGFAILEESLKVLEERSRR